MLANAPSVGPTISPLVLAHLFLAANSSPIEEADSVMRKHCVVFPSPPSQAALATSLALQLMRATPRTSQPQSPTSSCPTVDVPEPQDKGKAPEGKSSRGFFGGLRAKKKERQSGEKSEKRHRHDEVDGHTSIQRAIVFLATSTLKRTCKTDAPKETQQALGAVFVIQNMLMPMLSDLDRVEIQQIHATLFYAICRGENQWVREGCCRLATDLLCTLEETRGTTIIPKPAFTAYEALWPSLQHSSEYGSSMAAIHELLMTVKRMAPFTAPKGSASNRIQQLSKVFEWAMTLSRGHRGETTNELLKQESLELDPIALNPELWSPEADVALLKQFAPEGKFKDNAEFHPVEGVAMPKDATQHQLRDRAKAVYAFF
jgi:hypothetical protein